MKASYLETTLVSDILELKAIDETIPAFYLGSFEEAPVSAKSLPLMKGDWYFSTTTKRTYVYTSSGEWKAIESGDENFATMALSTLPDKFNVEINTADEVIAENVFVKNIISSFVTASYIAAKDIELQSGGAVRSKDYNKGTVKKLINGEELPALSPERGFYLDTQGDAEFYRADMYEVNINKGNISDVTVTGELKSDTFTTQKEDLVSDEISNIPIEDGVGYWAAEDLAISLSEFESGVVQALSGNYMGSSFSKALKLSEQERYQRYTLINVSSYSESTVPAPGVKVTIRFEGKPTTYHFLSLNGEKEVDGKIQYSIGSSWYDLNETVSKEVPAIATISMRGVKPDVPQDALVFTKKKYKTSASNIQGYAFSTPELSALNISCVVVSQDGLSRHTFNQDASVCNSFHSGISFSDYFAGVAYSNSRLVILDGYKRTFVSTDGGSSFTSYSISIGGSSSTSEVLLSYDGVFYIFVFTGSTISNVVYSSDGASWSKFSSTSFGITKTMRDFVQVGSYLYALETGGKVVRTPNLGYFETLKTFDISSSYPGHLSYANSTFFISNGTTLRASKDAVNWYEPLLCTQVKAVLPLDGLYCIKLGDNGLTYDDVYEAELMSQSSAQIYDKTNMMKASYDWSNMDEGWNFINYDGRLIGCVSIASPLLVPLDTNLNVSQSGTSLFNSSTAPHYYRYRGLRKSVNEEFFTVLSGVVGKIDLNASACFSFKRKGEEEIVIEPSLITAISWDSTGLVLKSSTGTFSLSQNDYLSSLSITFTPVGRSRGNYSEDIYPETLISDRERPINIGAADNPFDAVYANTFFGKLGTLLQELGDSESDVVSQKAIKDAINNTAAELLGNINLKINKSGDAITGALIKNVGGGSWIHASHGQDAALMLNQASPAPSGYTAYPLWSLKTINGSWACCGLSGSDNLYFVYGTDSNYDSGNNSTLNLHITSSGEVRGGTVYGAVWN